MRVAPPAATIRQRWKQDRGVTSAIFVLMLAVFLGMTGFVVDLTSAWMSRRTLITTTDAAALAAVQDYVENQNGCATTAPNYVARNDASATMTGCSHTAPTATRPGRVTVEAESDVAYIFAPILGITGTTVDSSTTASYDLASTVEGGLRPFGLCVDVVNELLPPVVPGNGVVYRIVYGKDAQPDACSGGDDIPGNWGILDFDGGANQQNDIKDWTENGYDGPVAIGDIIEGDTGAYSNSLNSELNSLLSVESFALPIFDVVAGNGANAEFRIENFAAVRLDGYKTTGPQDDRYLDIEFLDAVVQGGGGGDPTDLGAYVIGICAVDGVNPSVTCQ